MMDCKLTRKGRLTIYGNGRIEVDGFAVKGDAMCRDLAALAMLWGIGVLQKELAAVVAKPGGNLKCGIGDPDWRMPKS